jgi:hypothetical protein
MERNKIMRRGIIIGALALVAFTFACKREASPQPAQSGRPQAAARNDVPTALPANGFRAAITLVEPPTKLRSGQKETVRVRVKNASDVMWWARGAPVNPSSNNKFYIATGNRWLKSDGSLSTDMDGRSGIGKDLNPGEETEVPLVITAPKEPGEYTLEIDVIQEQVAWFSDKGSPTAKTKITIVR